MPFGTEVDLGPGHIVLGGDPAPLPRKGHSSPPVFSLCLLLPNGRPSQLLLSTCSQCGIGYEEHLRNDHFVSSGM